MIDRKNSAESRSLNPFELAAAAIVACAVTAAVLLVPAGATSQASATTDAAIVGEGTGYLPAEYVNQATEIAPQPPTF
jgi:hypothetical protein